MAVGHSGSFDKEYLSLPEEVLVTVMRDHQKYFAVEDAQGKLAPHFLAVLNTDGDPDGLIRHGNERVLRARFNDARFFWDTDQKTPLVNRVEMLKAVTFQKDLGSYAPRLSAWLQVWQRSSCAALEKSGQKVDSQCSQQAARLAKTDLTTELVKEFTELQGIVGGLYAKAQGLPASRRRSQSTTSTSLSRWKILRREHWKARCSPSPIKQTPLPECLRWGWFHPDRKIHLRCGGRRTEL